MPMPSWTFALASIVYPLPPPPNERTKELKVICCGLPRSGTESLHNALGVLGYSEVSQGFVWWFRHVNQSVLYYKLAMLRTLNQTPDAETLRREYFDRLLGHCDASTDIPAAWFCEELLAAYPDAKVILNRRRDTKAWKESSRASVLPMTQSWSYWLWSWFDAELFWGVALTAECHGNQLFKGDFEANAEIAYNTHYEKLESILDSSGRHYLKWSVEDGWGPICKFLRKQMPSQPFPEGNVAAEFGPKLMVVDEQRIWKAKQNASTVVGAAIFAAVAVHSLIRS